MRVRLFLSLLTLVRHIKNDKINPEDLDRDLFFMWCTRSVACNFDDFSNPVRSVYGNTEEGRCIHILLMSTWRKAEQEGRLRWRERQEDQRSYEELNAFLVANGYGGIAMDIKDQQTSEFDISGATERIRAACLDIEVVSISRAPA